MAPPSTPPHQTALFHIRFTPTVLNSSSHLLFIPLFKISVNTVTPPRHTSYSHLLFNHPVHTSCTHFLCTRPIQTSCSHLLSNLLFTAPVQTSCLFTHLPSLLRLLHVSQSIHSSFSHLLFIPLRSVRCLADRSFGLLIGRHRSFPADHSSTGGSKKTSTSESVEEVVVVVEAGRHFYSSAVHSLTGEPNRSFRSVEVVDVTEVSVNALF